MIRLARSLERINGLYQLDVRFSSMGNDGAMYLASALKTNFSLRVLGLYRNLLTSRGAKMLSRGLMRNRTLMELDVGLNEIGDQGCCAIASALSTAGCSLRRLKIKSNNIGDSGMTSLFKALRRNFKLSYLDVSDNTISDCSLSVLAEVLVVNRTLRELVANSCQISGRGCGILARPLKANNVLKSIALNENAGVGDVGLELIADGLRYNRTVEELCLDSCGVTSRGLMHLLDVIKSNKSFRTVTLCNNNIGTNGRTYLNHRTHIDSQQYERQSALTNYRSSGETENNCNCDANMNPRVSCNSEATVVQRHHRNGGQPNETPFSTIHDEVTDDILCAKLLGIAQDNSQLKISLVGNPLVISNQRLLSVFTT